MSNESVRRISSRLYTQRPAAQLRRAVRATRWNPRAPFARYAQHVADLQKVVPAAVSAGTYLWNKLSDSFSQKNNKMPPAKNYVVPTPTKPKKFRLSAPTKKSMGTQTTRRAFGTSQGTQTRPYKHVQFIGAHASKSSGFFKKGTSMKKYRKKPLMKYSVAGTNRTVEAAKIQTGTNAVWIGHATFARDNILRQAVLAIFYKFFVDQQLIRDATLISDAIASIPATSTITIYYRTSVSVSSTSAVFTAGASTSLQTIVDWFMDSARPWATSIGAGAKEVYDMEFLEIVFAVGTITKNMLLTDTLVNIYVKSSLKMQNRTKAAVGGASEDPDDSGNIDNVPLYGKSYSGNGTGLLTKLPYYGEIFSDRQFGVITGSEVVRGEPPQPRDFTNVKYCGKAHLEPGEIKTSILTSKFNMYFNTLFRACAPAVLPSAPAASTFALQNHRRRDFGKYRVFCVEKMIDVGAADLIQVAFENNMEISAKAKVIKRKVGVLKEFGRYDIA